MTEIIDSITVMGVEYKIEYVDVVSKEEPMFGQVDYFTNTITIDKSLTDDAKRVTLIHELMHCICWSLGLYELGENETVIQSISSVLYDFWKNNRAVLGGWDG